MLIVNLLQVSIICIISWTKKKQEEDDDMELIDPSILPKLEA